MKKIYLLIVLVFTLFSFGCASTETELKDIETETTLNQESEPRDGIENVVIVETKKESVNGNKDNENIDLKTESTNSIEEKIYFFDNVFSSFEYPGKKVNEINIEGFISEEDCIPFEGVFIDAPVSGKMHFDNSKEEPVIERIEFVVFEDDLSQDDCQAYLYNTYGALIAEGTEDDVDGQIYWRRYFTGQKILKYSKKAKDDFYIITIE